MYRAFPEIGDYLWVDILSKLVELYNDTVHRTIRTKPHEGNERNERLALQRIRKNSAFSLRTSIIKPRFKEGDRVRMS